MIDLATLKAAVRYEPETGLFYRLPKPGTTRMIRVFNGRYANKVAGFTDDQGYVVLSIENKRCHAHRLAWLYMTGQMPADEIDHINRNPTDNRWSNLREATRSQNARNRGTNAKSGLKGVHYLAPQRQWRAAMWDGSHFRSLGLFPSRDEAYRAYCAAVEREFGEFASVA